MPVKRLSADENDDIYDMLEYVQRGQEDIDVTIEDLNHYFAKIYGYNRTARRKTQRLGTRATPKKKPSAWNKFVKTNSKKKEFQYRDGKINLKKLGVAYRRKKK